MPPSGLRLRSTRVASPPGGRLRAIWARPFPGRPHCLESSKPGRAPRHTAWIGDVCVASSGRILTLSSGCVNATIRAWLRARHSLFVELEPGANRLRLGVGLQTTQCHPKPRNRTILGDIGARGDGPPPSGASPWAVLLARHLPLPHTSELLQRPSRV